MSAVVASDEDIRMAVECVVHGLLPSRREVVRASVRDGVVLLVGHVEWRSELAPITAAVRAVPDVVEVQNRVGFRWRDE